MTSKMHSTLKLDETNSQQAITSQIQINGLSNKNLINKREIHKTVSTEPCPIQNKGTRIIGLEQIPIDIRDGKKVQNDCRWDVYGVDIRLADQLYKDNWSCYLNPILYQ